MKAVCLQCHTSLSNYRTLSLGKLPVCNRFEKHPTTRVGKHALSISECAACNLVQLSQFPKAKFVRPRIPWIKYNEPMAHLEHVVQRLLKLLPVKAANAIGVGPFDQILLDQLACYTEFKSMLDISEQIETHLNTFHIWKAFRNYSD